MFSICTYIAENNDSLNLVEGERVYVIGKNLVHSYEGQLFYTFILASLRTARFRLVVRTKTFN